VDGIYAVTVSYSSAYEHATFKGMLYIGNQPTVNGTKRAMEVNIFDFNIEIYGETLMVASFKTWKR
jgi:riboflavin kinase / FMN adenylyltransferase